MPEKTILEHFQDLKQISREAVGRGGEIEYSTGITFIDEATGGFTPGEIWIIAGKSGGGKTTLGLQFAKNFADNPKHSILFLSLEMRGWELVLRLYAEMFNLNSEHIKRGFMPIDEATAKTFEDYLARIDFEIVEYGYKFQEIERIIAKYYKTKKPDCIFLDFIQLIDWRQVGDERKALDEYMRKIKELANTMGVGFVVLSQLRRYPTGADYNRPPDMVDLKGSGGMEAAADKILLIYKTIKDEQAPEYFINLVKNRQGRTVAEQVLFEGQYHRFSDVPKVGGL